MKLLKDEVLNGLAERGANVAQFVSFGPDEKQRFCRVRNVPVGQQFPTVFQALECLLQNAEAASINIRTFLVDKPDGNPFEYGLKSASDAEAKVVKFLREGFHVIVNETIHVNDGGFSGVVFGSLIEGAPNDIPRCVEKPGCMQLPRAMGLDLIKKVYGFVFHMPFDRSYRVEFSVHPHRVGYGHDRQIIWQAEQYDAGAIPPEPQLIWPNKFSRIMGDKAFGLLVADLYGFPVPRTMVFGRQIPQFELGLELKNGEPVWVRTVPKEQTPGKFQTVRGYKDPFQIMQDDDPDNTKIAAILIQDGVPATYSGSAITSSDGEMILEGCRGYGDDFMIGQRSPEELPASVTGETGFLFDRMRERLGDIRFEWVFDGRHAWVLQLHRGKSASSGSVIYPGTPARWVQFDVQQGLEPLRALVAEAQKNGLGVVLNGEVGITSHFGDILRKAKVPARLLQIKTNVA